MFRHPLFALQENKMKDHHVKLTETDREILKSYSTMLEGLSMYLGEGYELVLHSLEDYSSSAVKVIHGLHTGRTEGAPLTDLALDLLEEMQKEDADSRGITYFTHNKKGEPLKSVTIPVRGEKDRIIGLLCINFYLNTPFSEYISNFVACGLKPQDQYENRKENFSSSSVELLEDMAEEIRREVIEDKDIPTSNRNKEIIQRLYQKGVYNMKDAVGRTAEILGISKNTVYLHLRNLEQE